MNETHAMLEELSGKVNTIAHDHEAKLERLNDALAKQDLRFERIGLEGTTPTAKGRGPFLELEQKAAPHFGVPTPDYRAEDVRLGALLLGVVAGRPVVEQFNDHEHKAFSELTDAAGEYLVPLPVSSMFIDSVRPLCRVHEAGALTYSMEAPVVRLPGWDSDHLPAGAWRAEGDPFATGDGRFKAVVLTAKMVYATAEVSIELLQDSASNLPGAAAIVETELAKALAQAIDRAALVGDLSNGEPTGLLDTVGITPSHLADVPASYDWLVSDYFACASANETPTAAIYSARTAKTLALLKDGYSETSLRQLPAPEPIASLRRLVTNQVPDDLGETSDESVSFVGDWTDLLIGYRPDLSVQILRDPYSGMAAAGMVRLYAWLRADVAVLNPKAFAITDQIKS